MTSSAIQGITEDDIANFLGANPGFFERHAELLASVQLTSPHGQRAVSLQERQMEMLRERIKGLERKLIELIRYGQDNTTITDRLHRWTLAMLQVADASLLPVTAVQELQREFLVPQATLRLWNLPAGHEGQWFAQAVGDDVRTFAASLAQPYCGGNAGFEAVQWFEEPDAVASMAMLPLRDGRSDLVFGLLALASPDPTRFAADMGTDFLTRVAEVAGAAMGRLRAG